MRRAHTAFIARSEPRGDGCSRATSSCRWKSYQHMHCYKYELSVVPFWLVIPFVCTPPRGFRLSASVKINSGINNLSKIRCIQNVLGALRPTHLHDYCIYFALPRVLACHIICMSRYVLRRRHSASARSSPSAPCAAPVCLATQF